MSHDFYNICAGYFAIWCVVMSSNYVLKDVVNGASIFEVYGILKKYGAITLKAVYIGLVWTAIVPLIVGVLYELAFVAPVYGAMNESPRIIALQTWALGFVFTKVWIRCSVLGVFGENDWKRRFDRVWNEGLGRLTFAFIFHELTTPALLVLGDVTLVPFFVGVSAARISGFFGVDYAIYNGILRYSYLFILLLRFSFYCASYIAAYATKIYNDIRDSKYLVAEELTNR